MDNEKIKQARAAQQLAQEKKQAQETAKAQIGATVKGASHIAKTISAEAEKTRSSTQRVEVTNQKFPTSIKTPDVQRVVDALESLKQPLLENKPNDTRVVESLLRLDESIKSLPALFPNYPEPVETVTVNNFPDYRADLKGIKDAVSKIDVKPVINIPVDKPDDYTVITSALEEVKLAIGAIKIPEVPTPDLLPLINAMSSVKKSIDGLTFPVPNFVLPYKDANGKATQAIIDNAGGVLTSSTPFASRIDDSAGTITYIGKAPIGSSGSAQVWQIAKLDTSSGMIKTWAGNAGFTQIWDDRASLTYS